MLYLCRSGQAATCSGLTVKHSVVKPERVSGSQGTNPTCLVRQTNKEADTYRVRGVLIQKHRTDFTAISQECG